MTNLAFQSTRRLALAKAGRIALSTVFIAASLAMTGCASSTLFSSRVDARPSSTIRQIEIDYIENDMRVAGLAVSEQRDDKLERYGYYDLGRLLAERAPALFAANGLSGTVKIVPQPRGDTPAVLGPIPAGTATLILAAKGLQEQKVGLLQHRAYISVGSQLLDQPVPGGGAGKRLWTSNVTFRLGWDEALGVMKIHRIDPEFVDNLLKGLLNNMAADGMVALASGKAVLAASR